MKKIKLLTPIFGLTAISSAVIPLVTSCSNGTRTVPSDLLKTNDYTLTGLKKDADLSKYNTIVIPEGIKYVDNNAFTNAFVTGAKNGTIRTIVMPKTLRGIRANAFAGCDSLRVLDFSSWSVDEINDAVINDDTTSGLSFTGLANVGKVIMNNNLSEQSKKILKEKLMAAGLSNTWFEAEAINTKITADKAWMDQKIEKGKTNYLFKLSEKKLATNVLLATVTKTSGTDGIDVTTINTAIASDSEGIITVPVTLMNHANTGDYAQFDVTFAMVDVPALGAESEVLWVQTIKGFKLTNIKPDKVLVEEVKLTAEPKEVEVGKTLQIQSEVLPSDATNKELEWKSSNDAIATVDQTGKVTGVASGTVTITATAKDGSTKVGSIEIDVTAPGIVIPFTSDKFSITDLSNIELNKKYKFIIKGDDITDGNTYYGANFWVVDNLLASPHGSVSEVESIVYKKTGAAPVTLEKGSGKDYEIKNYESCNYIHFSDDNKFPLSKALSSSLEITCSFSRLDKLPGDLMYLELSV